MDAASNLILTDQAQEDAADELLAALSDLAYPREKDELVIVDSQPSKFKSKFFFKPTKSLTEEVDKRKDSFKKKKLVHVDDLVTKRLKDYKKTMPDELEGNIEAVREFFLKVIGPKALAGSAGISQARDIVQRLLGSEVDSTQFVQFDRMSREAISILMANFIAEYYELPRKHAQRLVDSIKPKRPVTIPLPPSYESRHEKARKHREESKEGSAPDGPVPGV